LSKIVKSFLATDFGKEYTNLQELTGRAQKAINRITGLSILLVACGTSKK
jgi:hypothetical protein